MYKADIPVGKLEKGEKKGGVRLSPQKFEAVRENNKTEERDLLL